MHRVNRKRILTLASLCGLGLLLGLNFAWGRGVFAVESGPPGAGGMPFAIADLDGDREPDLAYVEVERDQTSSTRYGIRLQFGEGTNSYIGVKGPLGGLRLVVRDVNGDDRLDLVVTSAMDRRVVQVLLNDGHGRFASAEAGSFSWLQTESETSLRERESGPSDRMILAGLRTASDADVIRYQISAFLLADSAGHARTQPAARSCELRSRHGRSPPVLPTAS